MDKTAALTIRNITLGSGMPKICVPIVETTEDEILQAAAKAYSSCADLVEWRCDYYQDIHNHEKVAALLSRLRDVLGEKPLLFTYRTKNEGGAEAEQITAEEYEALKLTAIDSCGVDIIDVELGMGETMNKRLAEAAHRISCYVLCSNHDFRRTPEAEELCSRYKTMEQWGADILKIAVMPQNVQDVLTLLTVCHQVSQTAACPVIGISMGSLGLESRICTEAFGSAMTFGSLGKPSAPGQMDADVLHEVLMAIHAAH